MPAPVPLYINGPVLLSKRPNDISSLFPNNNNLSLVVVPLMSFAIVSLSLSLGVPRLFFPMCTVVSTARYCMAEMNEQCPSGYGYG